MLKTDLSPDNWAFWKLGFNSVIEQKSYTESAQVFSILKN